MSLLPPQAGITSEQVGGRMDGWMEGNDISGSLDSGSTVVSPCSSDLTSYVHIFGLFLSCGMYDHPRAVQDPSSLSLFLHLLPQGEPDTMSLLSEGRGLSTMIKNSTFWLLLTIVIMLYITSSGLIYLVTRSLHVLTAFTHFTHPPTLASGNHQSISSVQFCFVLGCLCVFVF